MATPLFSSEANKCGGLWRVVDGLVDIYFIDIIKEWMVWMVIIIRFHIKKMMIIYIGKLSKNPPQPPHPPQIPEDRDNLIFN